ncbi:hypothetical protein KEM52_002726, partial [Ascosphaera acerosa]
RHVWAASVRACAWERWERWPRGAAPHRVALVADPQLVDAHTYPGRGPLLQRLTEYYTDHYLYRGYASLQAALRPDTTVFLGDLFDGGREWATPDGGHVSPEERFRGYGDEYWRAEYGRFAGLFFDTWHKLAGDGKDGRRKIIAGLPGNHDLGFSNGVSPRLRERFEAHFGPANRVDVLGNHTFVSIDAPSLSAMDPGEREAARTAGAVAGEEAANEAIWKPAADFLARVPALRSTAVRDEMRRLRLRGAKDTPAPPEPQHDDAGTGAGMPTIVLSHIPFWRDAATPCGPLRERLPGPKAAPDDERNSLQIARGYQYQNVLTDWVTQRIFDEVGGGGSHGGGGSNDDSGGSAITAVFSGDDHDYCEVRHERYAPRGDPAAAATEVTVKSISMAMGVRRPGFLLVSLWNPLDLQTGASLASSPAGGGKTIQHQLCLLPDQVGVFVRYAAVLGLTLGVLAARAACLACACGAVPARRQARAAAASSGPLPLSQTPLEDVQEDLPLLPLYHQPSAGRASRPLAPPLVTDLQSSGGSNGTDNRHGHGRAHERMKSVSSPISSNGALPFSPRGGSTSGHSRGQGSVGGRGRARSLTLTAAPALPGRDHDGLPPPLAGAGAGAVAGARMGRDSSDRQSQSPFTIELGTVSGAARRPSPPQDHRHQPAGADGARRSGGWSARGCGRVVAVHVVGPLKPVAAVTVLVYLVLLWSW